MMNSFQSENYDSLILKIIVGIFLISGVLLAIQGYALIADRADKGKNPKNVDAVEIQIRIVKNEWRWEPNEIVVPAGSFARLRIFNEDSYRHGFVIQELGVDEILPALQETLVEFSVSEPGEYPFSCSVLCGRGHFDMKGVLIAR